MKVLLLASLAIAGLATAAIAADDNATEEVPNSHGGYNVVAGQKHDSVGFFNKPASPTLQVPNSHGGYNVMTAGAKRNSIAFFGPHGYAEHVSEEAKKPVNFVLKPVVQDTGHGVMHTVYKKVYYATPEDAAAARLQ